MSKYLLIFSIKNIKMSKFYYKVNIKKDKVKINRMNML